MQKQTRKRREKGNQMPMHRTKERETRPRTPRGRTSATLDLGHQRLLIWLERYPFQRVQDLVVALRPWEGRGAVYRRLADLHARHLVERIAVASIPREPLYHLSPAGSLVCSSLVASADSVLDTPRGVRAEREKLANMLPRVPVWMTMQDVVNGLVLYAARALAKVKTGEQARVVRWNWVRDWSRGFWEHGDQAGRRLRARADGALSLCLRFSGGLEEWYTVLLLFSPLDDGRLLRARLDRLVGWREALARERRLAAASPLPLRETHPTPALPPVLMLARTARQAERWHLAAAGVALQRHQEAPCGAVALLPEAWQEGEVGNSWRLPWRRLDTERACHLRELLQPSGAPTLPDLEIQEQGPTTLWNPLVAGRAAVEATRVARVPLPPRVQVYALARLAHRKAHGGAQGENERVHAPQRTDERLTSVRLVRRAWEILWLLLAHPLLGREELAVFLGLSEKSVQLLLSDLVQCCLLIRAETTTGRRYALREPGLRLLARAAGCSVSRFVRLPLASEAPLEQRGVAGLLHQVRHIAGVYAFFADLTEQLAGVPRSGVPSGARLCWWETGAACEHVFTYREQQYHFQPDALAEVQVGTRSWRFWLEWDRGTMGTRDLERKCATYAAYVTSREWARGGAPPPALIYIAPEIGQERRFGRAAQALLDQVPGLRVFTTTAELLARLGVLAPIFQPAVGHESKLPSASRRALFAPDDEH